MRHHNKNKKFSRLRKTRNALLRSLAVNLIMKGKMKTTEVKAKAIRPIVEKLISQGRVKSLTAERLLISRVGLTAARKILNTLGPKYIDRKGGYLRITKISRRVSDNTPMAIVEFL